MGIGTIFILAIIICFAVKSYLRLKKDFFTFIAALVITFLVLYAYFWLLSRFTFQPQNALGNFLSCLAILASYQYLILEAIAWIAQRCYNRLSAPNPDAHRDIGKWFQDKQLYNCSKPLTSNLPIYKLLKNCTYLHLVAIYVISQVSSFQSINPADALESEGLLAVIGVLFFIDTFVDNQVCLLNETNRQH